MNHGVASSSEVFPCHVGDATEAQFSALSLLRRYVQVFLDASTVTFPPLDWECLFQHPKQDYSGDLVLKAQELTLQRVAPALPPASLAGSVDSVALASEALRPWLLDPWRSILPADSWPDVLPTAKVHVRDSDWDGLLELLHARGVVRFLTDEELVRHPRSGEPILNGFFGVPKGSVTDSGFSLSTCSLRLIVNAIPANSVQLPVLGEI